MKTFKAFALAAITALAFSATSCKDSRDNEQVGKSAGDGEDYINQQGQSSTTETGQNIGTDADSTTVTGEPGNRSNH